MISINEKLRGLYTVWSEIKHYYPYRKKLESTNWDTLVDEYVQRVIDTDNIRDYYFELMRFISHVDDDHTSIVPPWKYIVPDYSKPAIEVTISDGVFKIIRVGNNEDLKANDIRVNQFITAIDGVPINDYFKEINHLYARGSKQANEAINSFYLLMGPVEKDINLDIIDNGSTRSVSLKRDCTSDGEFFLDRIIDVNPSYKLSFNEGTLLVDIREFNDDSIVTEYIECLNKCDVKEIHFDLRLNLGGNDRIAYQLIEQVISSPLHGVKYKYKVGSKALNRWGYEDEWKISERIVKPNNTTNFSGKVKIFFDGATSSTAEDFVIAMKDRPNTSFEGELTAGSSGNPYTVDLPAGGQLRVSTFIALDSNDFEYVGIGFNPNK